MRQDSSSGSAASSAAAGAARSRASAARTRAAFFLRVCASCSSLSRRAFSLPVPRHPMPNPPMCVALFALGCALCVALGAASSGPAVSSSSLEDAPRFRPRPLRRSFAAFVAAARDAASASSRSISLRIALVMPLTRSTVFGLLLPFAIAAAGRGSPRRRAPAARGRDGRSAPTRAGAENDDDGSPPLASRAMISWHRADGGWEGLAVASGTRR